MSSSRLCITVIAVALLATFLWTPSAQAEFRFKDGMWRFEIAAGAGYDSGKRDREGDFQLVGEIEYEIPATERITLGLRALPLIVYTQDDKNEDTLWGAGVGIALRYYQVPSEYRGWFGELEGAAFGHSGKLEGNSSNFNFLIGAGVGYQFKNSWHTTVKIRHISNASTSSSNAGANTINLGVGYRW